jgi:hypothetical protein
VHRALGRIMYADNFYVALLPGAQDGFPSISPRHKMMRSGNIIS